MNVSFTFNFQHFVKSYVHIGSEAGVKPSFRVVKVFC